MISTPRSRVPVQELVEFGVLGGDGLVAAAGSGCANRYSARAPSWTTDQGRSCSSIVDSTPSRRCVASSIMRANGSSGTPRQAWRAQPPGERVSRERATTPPVSSRSASAWASICVADSALTPDAADRDPAGDRLADRDDVGVEAPGRSCRARTGAEGVRLRRSPAASLRRGSDPEGRRGILPAVGQCRCWSAPVR